MGIDKLGPAGTGAAGVSPRASFRDALDGAREVPRSPGPSRASGPREGAVAAEPARSQSRVEDTRKACAVVEGAKSNTGVDSVQSARAQHVAQVLDGVDQARKQLDHVLRLAESGRTFTATELLGLQARVYRASQELDLAGKVVEKATSGVKQVLQTQI
ncbi:ATP-dependent helicase HrpB [Corallococcus sp. H22C18031201]|nr:ATP-dependent helicase HrpB [Corallococcus sp. H22C18031201]